MEPAGWARAGRWPAAGTAQSPEGLG